MPGGAGIEHHRRVHVRLQQKVGIRQLDADFCRACRRIECWINERYGTREAAAGIGRQLHGRRYADAHCREVLFEHVRDDPDIRQIGDAIERFSGGEALTGKDYQNAWCHMDNAIATCAYAPNAKSPVTGKDYPPDQWWNRYAFTSAHTQGVNFAMTDGSVQFISDSISLTVFRALGTRAVGEVAGLP